MKRLLALLTLLALTPAVLGLSLSNYPDMFFEQEEFNTKIVVGAKAPSQDVASAVEMIPLLQSKADEQIKGSMLDKDVTDYTLQSKNIISMGKVCDNTVTADILETDECGVFKEGTGYILMKESELGKTWMVVAGGTPDDTEKAAMVLANPDRYDLKGKVVKVTGEEPPYEIEETTWEEVLPGTEEKIENKTGDVNETLEEVETQTEEVTDGDTTEDADVDNDSLTRSDELNAKIERLTQEEPNETPKEEKPSKTEEKEPTGDTWYETTWVQFKDWLNWFFTI